MEVKTTPSVRGRPRAFDMDEALDRALRVFWEKGYEGASLSDLTRAMGINRPSLYAAFGDKETLFRKALDRYSQEPLAALQEALAAPTARAAAERVLMDAAERQTRPRTPAGCLLVQGALSCAEGAEAIRRELAERRHALEVAARGRFRRAKKEGDLPADADPADLARFIATVIQGMAVQAAGGATREELRHVAALAMKAWPS